MTITKIDPVWASLGDTSEPSEAKKELGWVPSEQPVASDMNWLIAAAEEKINKIIEERITSHAENSTIDPYYAIATGLWPKNYAETINDQMYISGGNGKGYTDLTTIFVRGEPRLLALDWVAKKVEMWDPRTLELLDTSPDLTLDMPAGTWTVVSICGDNDYMYALLYASATQTLRAQAFLTDASWGVHPDWPSDGIEICTTGGVVSTYRAGKIIVANSDSLAVLAHNITVTATPIASVVSILQKEDGMIVAAGSGDATVGSISIPDIVSDGTNLYFSTYTGAGAFELATCKVLSPTEGSGGTGYANALQYGGDDFRLGVCGNVVFSAHVDSTLVENDILMQTHRASRADLDALWAGESSLSAAPLDGRFFNQGSALALCTDGIHIWVMSSLQGQKGACRVTKYDVAKFHVAADSVATKRQALDLSPKSYILGSEAVTIVNALQCSCTFDGRDLWCVAQNTHGSVGSGIIYRLPLCVLRG